MEKSAERFRRSRLWFAFKGFGTRHWTRCLLSLRPDHSNTSTRLRHQTSHCIAKSSTLSITCLQGPLSRKLLLDYSSFFVSSLRTSTDCWFKDKLPRRPDSLSWLYRKWSAVHLRERRRRKACWWCSNALCRIRVSYFVWAFTGLKCIWGKTTDTLQRREHRWSSLQLLPFRWELPAIVTTKRHFQWIFSHES